MLMTGIGDGVGLKGGLKKMIDKKTHICNNGRFRRKNRSTRQKVFPLPTVTALSASNSSSALSARAG